MSEDKRTDALVLRAIDYKESDKLVTLLSAEGKLVLRMRGVRSAKSKLRYAAQPFFFGTYLLSQTKGGTVVVGCDSLSAFSFAPDNLGGYYVGCLVLEVADKLSMEGYEDRELFDLVITSLGILSQNSDNPVGFALRFMRDALAVAGHGLNSDFGAEPDAFSFDEGGLCLFAKSGGLRLPKSTAAAIISLINDNEVPKDKFAEVLQLLTSYFSVNIQKKLSTPTEIINMLELL